MLLTSLTNKAQHAQNLPPGNLRTTNVQISDAEVSNTPRRRNRKRKMRKQYPTVRLITRENLDGRSRVRRQFDAIANGIASDLGGVNELTTVEAALVEAFAGAAVHVYDLNARLLLGQAIDLSDHAHAISSLVRFASRIGTRRRARDVTPDPLEYARALDDDAHTDDARTIEAVE
jgi:hypothetical protein